MFFLSEIQLEDLYDSLITDDRLSVSQIDVTQNLWFDEDTDLRPIIRLFRKSNIPDDFSRNKKTIGFCVNANIVTVKAYDKIQDLRDKKLLPSELEKKNLLRLEVSMKREKFVNLLHLDRKDSIDTMLRAACSQTGNIINDYLIKLFPCSAPHFRFEEARKMVRKRVGKNKLRERMVFLLEKTSGTDGLDRAIRATSERFGLQRNQIVRIFEEFDKIGVNPITIPNNSQIEKILITLANKYLEKCIAM